MIDKIASLGAIIAVAGLEIFLVGAVMIAVSEALKLFFG